MQYPTLAYRGAVSRDAATTYARQTFDELVGWLLGFTELEVDDVREMVDEAVERLAEEE